MVNNSLTGGLVVLAMGCSFTQKRNSLEGITIDEVPVESLSDRELYDRGYLEVLEIRLRERIKEQWGTFDRVSGMDGVLELLRLARVEYEQASKQGSPENPQQREMLYARAEHQYSQLLQRQYFFAHSPTTACSAVLGGFSAYVRRVYGDELGEKMERAQKEFLQQTKHCGKRSFALFEDTDSLYNVK